MMLFMIRTVPRNTITAILFLVESFPFSTYLLASKTLWRFGSAMATCGSINLVISHSTASSKYAYPRPSLHIHIRGNTMVSLNLFSSNAPCDAVSDKPATQKVQGTDTANVFEHAYRHLADYRNICQVYHVRAYERQSPEIDAWANDLLKTLWTATAAGDPG